MSQSTPHCPVLHTFQSQILEFLISCSEHEQGEVFHLSSRFRQPKATRSRLHRKQHHRVGVLPTPPIHHRHHHFFRDLSPCSTRPRPYFLRPEKKDSSTWTGCWSVPTNFGWRSRIPVHTVLHIIHQFTIV